VICSERSEQFELDSQTVGADFLFVRAAWPGHSRVTEARPQEALGRHAKDTEGAATRVQRDPGGGEGISEDTPRRRFGTAVGGYVADAGNAKMSYLLGARLG